VIFSLKGKVNMKNTRRLFLKSSVVMGAVSVAAAAGMLTPASVLAAWPKKSFDEKKTDAALQALLGTSSHEKSDKIKVKAPPIAENGATVNIVVEANLDNVESMSLLVAENAFPLAINIETDSASVAPFAKVRLKIGKTSDVIAVVKANGKVYSASKKVKVTKGGCGG
jgi:sulfur-oxidizing protein SoxY